MRRRIRSFFGLVYSLTYSGMHKVTIGKTIPQAKQLGTALKGQLEAAYPGLSVSFFGSTNLGIPGRGDIDLYGTIAKSEFSAATNAISTILGPCHKLRRTFREWKTVRNGILIEFTLFTPDAREFAIQKRIFLVLSNDKELRNAYCELKAKAQNVSERSYALQKLRFFNQPAFQLE